MSFVEPKKLLNFSDHSGYQSLSREWFLKAIIFSFISILNTSKGKLQNTKNFLITVAYG